MLQTTTLNCGPVRLGNSTIHAAWTVDAGREPTATVRLSFDEFDALGLNPYQWIAVKLPGWPPRRALFLGKRDAPPFVLVRLRG